MYLNDLSIPFQAISKLAAVGLNTATLLCIQITASQMLSMEEGDAF